MIVEQVSGSAWAECPNGVESAGAPLFPLGLMPQSAATICQFLVQWLCIPLQNFALSAMAYRLPEPAAGLGRAFSCTTHSLCTFLRREARRREGDK